MTDSNTSMQFSKVHGLPPRQTTNANAAKRIEAVVQDQLRKLSQIAARPPNMPYYENLMTSHDVVSGSVPKIGVYCNMIPYELINAFGARSIRLGCGNPAAVPVGEEIITGDVCPLVKASVGMLLCPGTPASKCNLFVLPTSCDAKKKLGEILSDYKPVFMLNLPAEQNSNMYLDQTAKELERLAEFLGRNLGRRLDRGMLREEMKQSNKRSSLLREISKLRNSRPDILSIRDLFLVIQSSFSGISLAEWNSETQKALDWIAKEMTSPPPKGKKTRLVLTGAPILWPNFKVLSVLEESDSVIAADTLCTGMQSCIDPSAGDESSVKYMLRSLAMKYIFGSICPCFISQATKLNRVLDLVKETSSKGVVNHALRLCQLCDLENYRLHQILKRNGIPLLDVRTDYSMEDTEQLRIRVEAFLETIS
ncbi:MAG: 2-hydroxyacyl-CoA dehydratase family protein [Victivallales bacterium]